MDKRIVCIRKTKSEMERQTIDSYRLTSMEEPSDEVLSQLMQEAAVSARERSAEAHRLYFLQLQQEVDRQFLQYSETQMAQ